MTDEIDQKIAAKQAKIARAQAELAKLHKSKRAAEAGGKIVLGGLILNIAKTDAVVRERIRAEAEKLAREHDRKRALDLLASLPPAPQSISAPPTNFQLAEN